MVSQTPGDILIVDDEEAICWGLERVAEGLGYPSQRANSVEQALRWDSPRPPRLILLDVRLPGIDGLSAMRLFRERWGELPIVVMTAFGDLQTAVTAVRNGAFEYLIKPFDMETVRRVLQRAMEPAESGLRASPQATTSRPRPNPAVAGFVAQSTVMQEVFNRIALAADSDAAVLLAGASGTGKELAAHAIHQFSRRSAGPLVVVNVAALSPGLAESELFGHVRGAFTGAEQHRTGLIAQARGGTLFLDEVAEIPLPIQVKLLRALEQKQVLPVGADKPLQCDFRIITATHQDLARMVSLGDFRQDLYFRLTAFQIDLPPLRDRPGDIGPLANYFLDQLTSGGKRPELSPAGLQHLESQLWPGNVRELRNALEHALIASRGQTLLPEHFPQPAVLAREAEGQESLERQIQKLLREWARQALASSPGSESLYEDLLRLLEPPVLDEILQAHQGQVSNAARVLGLHRTTLRRKIDQYRLDH